MDDILELICDILFDSLSNRKIPLWLRRLFAIFLIIVSLAFSALGAIMIKDGIESPKKFLIIIGAIIILVVVLIILATIKEYRNHKK